MQKGDDNQQQQHILTSEYSTATNLVFNGEPYTSIISSACSDVPDYNDIAKVLSQVELPSPSPTLASFHEAQSSGAKNMVDDQIEEKELKDIHGDLQEQTGMQFQAQVTRGTRQRRRSRIHEKIRVLKALVPNCNKRDQASILDDAITHITTLQMQVQTMQLMGAGSMPQGLYMSPWRYPSLQGPAYLAPYNFSMGHYGSHITPISPVFPPLLPTMQGSPRLLPIPHLQFPSQTAYSTTLSSNTFRATGRSQVGSGISSQSPYHMAPNASRKALARMGGQMIDSDSSEDHEVN